MLLVRRLVLHQQIKMVDEQAAAEQDTDDAQDRDKVAEECPPINKTKDVEGKGKQVSKEAE